MIRKIKGSWIEAFCEETEGTSSPFIFRKWAGIMAVSGALERKVWMRSRKSLMFPNMYTVLVGPPGVGKTAVVDVVRQLWRKLKDVHVAASNVSRASLVDELKDANRVVNFPNVESFNALLVGSNELQVFLSAYEGDFIGVLTDLYDCKDDFSERKRGNALHFTIAKPSLTLLTGTTPSYLNNLFTDGAWDQGFASRTVFVFNGEIIRGDIFLEDEQDLTTLSHDLKIINNLYGKYEWEPDAARAVTEWYKREGPPTPTHPKLLHYRTRRHAQVLKLAMIAAAAVTDELVIRLEHYQTALDWLLEAEAFMADIFLASAGNDSKVIDDTWHYVYTVYTKEKKPVLAARVVNFVSQRVPVHSVGRLLEVMVASSIIKPTTEKEGTCYVPQPR